MLLQTKNISGHSTINISEQTACLTSSYMLLLSFTLSLHYHTSAPHGLFVVPSLSYPFQSVLIPFPTSQVPQHQLLLLFTLEHYFFLFHIVVLVCSRMARLKSRQPTKCLKYKRLRVKALTKGAQILKSLGREILLVSTGLKPSCSFLCAMVTFNSVSLLFSQSKSLLLSMSLSPLSHSGSVLSTFLFIFIPFYYIVWQKQPNLSLVHNERSQQMWVVQWTVWLQQVGKPIALQLLLSQ